MTTGAGRDKYTYTWQRIELSQIRKPTVVSWAEVSTDQYPLNQFAHEENDYVDSFTRKRRHFVYDHIARKGHIEK